MKVTYTVFCRAINEGVISISLFTVLGPIGPKTYTYYCHLIWMIYHVTTLYIHFVNVLSDERLVHDLPWGSGRSIGGDLDIGEEGSEQMIVTLQSLHHDSVGYQHVHTWVDLTKKVYPCKCNREHKQEQERMQLNLQMNVLAHECGTLQTVERWNCSW
jgi:hypothetical protein